MMEIELNVWPTSINVFDWSYVGGTSVKSIKLMLKETPYSVCTCKSVYDVEGQLRGWQLVHLKIAWLYR